MTPNLIKALKTLLIACLAAVAHTLGERIPDILPLIPAKYAGVVTVAVIAAGLYHVPPPSGDGGGKTAAALVFLIGLVAVPFWAPKVSTLGTSTVADRVERRHWEFSGDGVHWYRDTSPWLVAPAGRTYYTREVRP